MESPCVGCRYAWLKGRKAVQVVMHPQFSVNGTQTQQLADDARSAS
jgi:hypothetical protein